MPTEDLVRHRRGTQPPAQERPYQSADDRDRLVLENLPLVRLIARKFHDHLPGAIREGVSLEELVSAGIVGLISAVDRFDKTLNVKLERYADYRIREAIMGRLRSPDRAPRRQRKPAADVSAKQSFERMQRDIPEFVWAHALRTFGSASLAADWFVAECGALGNRPPIDTMNDGDGGREIDRILGCIDYGMIA